MSDVIVISASFSSRVRVQSGMVFFFFLFFSLSSFFPRGNDIIFLAVLVLKKYLMWCLLTKQAFFESTPFLVVLLYRDQYLGGSELSRPASGLSFFPTLSFAHSLPPLGEWCREVVRSRQWDREIMVKENRNKSARMRLGRIAEEWVSCLWQMFGYKGTLKLTQCRLIELHKVVIGQVLENEYL